MDIKQLPSEYYSSGVTDRKPYEDRAKLISRLTLPYVIREESDSGTTTIADKTSQSYGGRLVNTLKSKMGMALLPPSTSSFRFVAESTELEALSAGSVDNEAKIYASLSQATSTVNAEIESQQIRTSLFDIIVQLLVVGSVVVEKKKDDGVLIHGLQSFVCSLDSRGMPYKMCIVESLHILPEGIVPKEEKEEYDLYTMAYLDKDTRGWVVVQEVDGELVGTEEKYKSYDELPFRYLGWTWLSGDSYHRPFTEDYYKDLEQVDKMAKLLTDGAIASAKILFFVNEKGGRTRKDSVVESLSGDVVDGVGDDVSVLQVNKGFDFQMPAEREQALKKELNQSFLMNDSVTRPGERVTATEISFLAQELESSTLAGIYSKLALQWSKWIVLQVMAELKIKFDAVSVEILTGLDAMGRGQEAQKLDGAVQRTTALNLRHWLNDSELLNRYFAYEGVNTVRLLKTPKEVEADSKAQKEENVARTADEATAQAAGQTAGTNAANAVVPNQQTQTQG